jgi:uncharacterized protein (DUF885 family)
VSESTSQHIEKCKKLTGNPDNLSEPERLRKLFQLEFDYQMVEDPIYATYNGYPGQNHRWPDVSRSEIDRRKQEWQHWKRALTSINRNQLNTADTLSYDLFEHYLNDEIEKTSFPEEVRVISQMDGPQQTIPFVMGLMPAFKMSDCEDILARLRAIPVYIEQNIELMAQGLQRSITPPRPVLGDLADQILNQVTDPVENAPALDVLKSLPVSMPEAQQKQVRREAAAIFNDLAAPAFKKLHAYVVDTYLPNCRDTIAFREVPGGEDWYAYLVRSFTTTDMSPEEVFQTGQSEVKRIRKEMDEVVASAGFNDDFAAFTEFLRTDPQFYHEKAEDLVREYRDISKRADPELARLFGRLPALPYGVIPIPSFSEKSQTTAFYQPGSLEAGRPGYHYVNTYDLKSRPRWEMEALTLHEAVPGHHLQISLAQELQGLPEFRKKGWITAYGEGWALYAESLGKEMGFYTTPYSRFGQLTYEMWRAVRLVVDIGMHWKGWSRQQAIDFIIDNSGKTEHDVKVEVDRYIVWPGQALAYKIGELKIKELRNYAEETLGDKMSLREFHDQILCHGAMPLNLLEKHIRDWVSSI